MPKSRVNCYAKEGTLEVKNGFENNQKKKKNKNKNNRHQKDEDKGKTPKGTLDNREKIKI